MSADPYTLSYLRKCVRRQGGPAGITVAELRKLVREHGVEVRRFDGVDPRKADYLAAIGWPGYRVARPGPEADELAEQRIGDLADE